MLIASLGMLIHHFPHHIPTQYPVVIGILWVSQFGKLGLPIFSVEQTTAYGASYLALSLGTNIVLTALISIRLLLYRHRLLKHLPAAHGKQYISLVAVIVESAALYSVVAVLTLTTYATGNPVTQMFMTLTPFAQVRWHLYPRHTHLYLCASFAANVILSDHIPRRQSSGVSDRCRSQNDEFAADVGICQCNR